MKARLVYRNKLVTDNRTTELVILELPHKTTDRSHGIKYRLYHGDNTGHCIVRYDNESGKGDHKHLGEKEIPYQFVTVEQLIKDFHSDVTRLTHGGKHNE